MATKYIKYILQIHTVHALKTIYTETVPHHEEKFQIC